MAEIRVLIVDDSALVRQMLTSIFADAAGIEVVGTAADPYIAREKIKQLNPDVLTLDVEMPRMDGLTFLRNLMRLRPMPVVMISSLTERGADVTLDALELGAVDFVAKPKLDVAKGLEGYAEEIVAKVTAAAKARVHAIRGKPRLRPVPGRQAKAGQRQPGRHLFRTTDQLIAIGASTGGTEAIKEVLTRLPPQTPGTVITQHIPEAFSGPFAQRMDRVSAMHVCEAADRQPILPGHAYIAPGDRHLKVVRDGARYLCRLDDGERINRHRPSVDALFHSVAKNVGPNAIGVLLTGMGKDGAAGLLAMRDAGAVTIAQDEDTSVVWGMPGEAVKLGAVELVLPLEAIADHLLPAATDKERQHGA